MRKYIDIKQIKPYEFKVLSFTNCKKEYTLTIRKDKSIHCTCPAFKYHSDECKHIRAVKEYIDYSYIYELDRDELIHECVRLFKLTRKLDNIIWRP